MPGTFKPCNKKFYASTFYDIYNPIKNILNHTPALEARGDRPLQMNFEHQLKSLIYYHLEDHTSGRHLLQVLEEDQFAKNEIAPPQGIKKSSFFEAINYRGLEQLQYVFTALQANASKALPKEYAKLGDLISIDGSLIDAVLSMHWADYRNGSKKAKAHLGFDINHSIPSKIFLTDGKGNEHPFVTKILSPGQTGILDRNYQCHKDFDSWQTDGIHFVCRIKDKTKITVLKNNELSANSKVFYDALVLLGTPKQSQTEKPLRLIAYKVGGKKYWVATDRYDLTAEEIAYIYKLRWNIENFFAWWKRHLNVYHIIARSEYGLMVQILAGLITYILLAIYCNNKYNEKISIKRVREIRIKMRNEIANLNFDPCITADTNKQSNYYSYAKT